MYRLVTLLVCFAAIDASPIYQLVGYYVAPQFGFPLQPAIYAPRPQILHHRAHAATVRTHQPETLSPLITNTITYTADPDADPDDALEVAQFHSQDAAGRVIFGFNTPTQARMEARSVDGTVRGSYSYVDPYGKTVRMNYWDDGTGFHTSGNAGPGRYFGDQPYYTPEVQAARDQHFQLYEQALLAAAASGQGSEESSSAYDTGKQGVVIEGTGYYSQGHSSDEQPNHSSDNQENDETNDSVSIENPDYVSFQVGPVRKTSERKDSESILHTDSINAQSQDSELAIVTNVEQQGNSYQYKVPVPDPVNGRSESLHATLYGAIPVAAVHDAQVAPSQKDKVTNHQLLPVLLKTRPDTKSST